MLSVLAVVAAPRDAVVRGRPVDRHRRLDSVAEPDERVGHRASAVEVLDLLAKLSQDPTGPIETALRAEKTYVVPHGVANHHPVLCDQGRIHGLVLGLPGTDFRSRTGSQSERLACGRAPGAPAPEQTLEERRRRQA